MSNNCFENLSGNHKAWIRILTATIFHTDEEKYQLPMIWSVWTLCQQKVRRHWQNHFLEHATDVQTRVQHGIAYPIPRPTKRQSSTLARFYDFSAFFHKLSLNVKLDVKIFSWLKTWEFLFVEDATRTIYWFFFLRMQVYAQYV